MALSPQGGSRISAGSGRFVRLEIGWGGCQCFLLPICIWPFFCISLHWQEEHSGAPLFFIHQSPTPQKRLFHPKVGCHSARMALQKGPSGLPSVPLLRCCLGRVRKWMERMDLMSRMERDGKMDSEKCRVRLFHNLSKFHAIYGILSIIGHFDRLITFNLIYHLSSLVYRFKWLSLQLK